ncbi:MAG: FecR domain-containing protein [Candidatus Accumulibacter sp.]|jgi:transmembrane sensor|nr:FecR domain-containing protein [Accumulibacter sp.]
MPPPPAPPPDSAIPADLLKKAADWAMSFHYGAPTETERRAFEHWHQQSPAHAAAWARAQAVFHTFSQVPADIGKATLKNLERRHDRRRALRLLAALWVAAPAGWLAWRRAPWREWSADAATATGERQTLELPDGSRLVLNTASAVDIAFTAEERRIRLITGEILLSTHADPSLIPRPFFVDTPHGVVHALGTRFSVRHLAREDGHVAVFQDSVEIRPLGGPARILHAGEQAGFDAAGVRQADPVDDSAALWEHGMLLARDMRLADVIAVMARHRPGVLRCDPAVAELRLSGAISLADTDAGLAVLEKVLPLRIERRTRYWVTVGPR